MAVVAWSEMIGWMELDGEEKWREEGSPLPLSF